MALQSNGAVGDFGGPAANETTPLIDIEPPGTDHIRQRFSQRYSSFAQSSVLSRDELLLGETATGERIPYNAYTTIDWLHDLVKDGYRHRLIRSKPGLRGALLATYEDYQGWLAAILVGILTAVVAFFVDHAESLFGDLKLGFCRRDVFISREVCCDQRRTCDGWSPWSENFWHSFAIYAAVAWVLAMGAGIVMKLTRVDIPRFAGRDGEQDHMVSRHEHDRTTGESVPPENKVIYMAAGSGIPEIKLVLSGFEFPNLFSFKVLVVKAIGAALGVAAGLCLGKEGPFVHISTSAGHVVAKLFPQFRENGRRLREMLSVACSCGLAVAFGSPIGGVLYVYEEMSSHFPRKVLWQAFLCSLVAAVVLKSLDPSRTGRLVLLETNYGVKYKSRNYVFFILLGVCGGLFGAAFCKGSLLWTKSMKKIIDKHPLLELSGIVLLTALLQYPNPITRHPSLVMIKSLLSDCKQHPDDWICRYEEGDDPTMYHIWLLWGSVVKSIMTTITVGAQVPSGLIVPGLATGAIFGRLVGQLVADTSPGVFAMVGAAAFLAGISRMTVSLTVIMFELTGEVEYIPPFMISILIAKLVVDALHEDGVNDHTVLGEYIEHELAARIAQRKGGLARDLVSATAHMQDMTLHVEPGTKILKHDLSQKLYRMRRHGLRDAALVLVDQHGHLQGIISEAELGFVLHEGDMLPDDEPFDVLQGPLAAFVDRSPLIVNENALLEMVVEMFYELGLRHAVVVQEGKARVVGIVLKQQLMVHLEHLRTG